MKIYNNFSTVKHLLFAGAFLCFQSAFAQKLKPRFVPTNDFGLIVGNDTSLLGFGGALHAPSFSAIDLDLDGVEELVAKDAYSDREMVFKRTASKSAYPFKLAKHLEEILPNVSSYFIFYDMDNDGLKDLITGDDKLRVYYNLSSTDSVMFAQKPLVLKEKLSDGNYAIEFQVGEQPTLADVDNDGLLDILIFNQDGDRVLFYKGIAASKTEALFELKTEKWGFFKETGLNFEIILGANKKAHPGSKVLAFDYENDGDIDLLISDITSAEVYFLENGKSDYDLPYDSMISATQNFPSSEPINISYFPSFSLIDYDNDGDKDLICSNSSRSPVLNGLVWLYENTATNGHNFTLKTRFFLQEYMIDLGIEASPSTFDFDGDGDLDLLIGAKNHVGNEIFADQIASLTLYENVGTKNEALFKLYKTDYLNLSEKAFEIINPTFGDLDNDNVPDLVFGTDKGEVFFMRNTAPKGQAYSFAAAQKIADIDVGSNAAPLVFDINQDGKNDLIIGELGGNLNYYKNTTSLAFELVSENWGGVKTNTAYWQMQRDNEGNIIDSSLQYLSIGNAHPSMADIDFDGQMDLIVGSAWGKIYYYEGISLAENSVFKKAKEWYHNPFFKQNFDKDLGGYCRPHLVDINQDGNFVLLVGTYNGGVELFGMDSVAVSIKNKPEKATGFLQIYPNPSHGSSTIENLGKTQISLQIYSLEGRHIGHLALQANETRVMNFAPGCYFFMEETQGKRFTYKLLVY